MSTDREVAGSSRQRWAQFRFSVVGPLLAAPPAEGELEAALRALSFKTYRHPITGQPRRFGFSTLERWYYAARGARVDPVGALRSKARKDQGRHPSMPQALRTELGAQHRRYPSWTYMLHHDNLVALGALRPELPPVPSYATVRRYMQSVGLLRHRRRGPRGSPGGALAEQRFATHEVRSYESSHVGGLWHLDFHDGSRKVLTQAGRYEVPQLLGVLDDRSRLCCHLQWYLSETAEELVHGLSQAFQKRGLPRGLLSDNGAAMVAGETVQGLSRLSIVQDTTLPYSPEQNGKQECFWAQVEGRLMAMLQDVPQLSLAMLNEATLAWVELEYNRKVHSELRTTPLARFLAGPDASRPCPSSQALRRAFGRQQARTQRRSDGTVSIEGVRFELPGRYRHIPRVAVRYARWDLGHVWLVDARTDEVLCRIYPLDRQRNADGRRRRFEAEPPASQPGAAAQTEPDEPAPEPGGQPAPLLRKLMADYARTGLPPAYLPKDDIAQTEQSTEQGERQ